MILTITPNTALDHTLFIKQYIPGYTLRATTSKMSMAGKAADVSWILGELGIPSRSLGFAAGQIGLQMEKMLQDKGVITDFTWVDGETRINTVIMCGENEPQTTITTNTLVVREEHVRELLEKYQLFLDSADCVVMGGSIPNGIPSDFYVPLIEMANRKGIPTIMDVNGRALDAAIGCHPTVIKPNHEEIAQLIGHPVTTIQALQEAAEAVRDQFGTMVVATLGSEGCVAALNGKTLFAPALKVEVCNPAGAGDGVVAGLAAGFAQHKPMDDALRLGIACAAAVVMMPGTAECRKADIELLLPQVQIITL